MVIVYRRFLLVVGSLDWLVHAVAKFFSSVIKSAQFIPATFPVQNYV
jgi:hypothetical protein